MRRALEAELQRIGDLLLRMGGCTEAIVAKAWRAVVERDGRLAAEVRTDDLEIDRLEIAIDEAVMRALALQAPVARDLRRVVAALAVSVDLERVGDLARNIAQSAARLAQREPVPLPARLAALAQQSRAMLRRALNALADRDAAEARRLLADDERVDEDEDRFIRETMAEIAHQPRLVPQHLDLILVAKALERVADHATNVAENTILIVEGRNVKHADKLAAEGPPRGGGAEASGR